MTLSQKDIFIDLKRSIYKEIKVINEINSLYKKLDIIKDLEEKILIKTHINSLKRYLKQINLDLPNSLLKFNLAQPLTTQKIQVVPESLIKKKIEVIPKVIEKTKKIPSKITFTKIPKKIVLPEVKPLKIELSPLEKETLKRLRKKEKKIVEKKERKASKYVQTSNQFFTQVSSKLVKQDFFKMLKSNLIKANLQFLPKSYISVILFTTLISIGVAFFLFFFFLIFNISPIFPIITLATEGIGIRFMKVFWLLFVIPIGTLLAMYFYPSLEEKSAENKINQELPFAAIHMSSIAGSMIDPSKIFSIILTTKEYPSIEKEFIKLLNAINILGYDLVTALRNSAINCPSQKLAELFNGLATTINSGGDLAGFFAKRAESLFFEYRIEREKRTRSAETFMDIYISVVIAAPMILMLLLMMMKISGLGIQLSTAMITLIMVMGVTGINIGFMTFLHIKQSTGGGQ